MLEYKNWSSQVQSKTNGCICNIKVIISLFFDDTTFRVYAHYEFQCLSFFMRCSSSSYSNLCVGFHVNLFNVCEKIARPHTRTRCETHVRTHTFFILSSVCCYEKSGFYIILCTPFYWAIIFFSLFFWQMLKMAERNLGKNQQAYLRIFFLESVTKSSN